MRAPLLVACETWDAEARAQTGPGGEVVCKAPDGRVLAVWRCSVDHQHAVMANPNRDCAIPSEQAAYFEAAIGEGRCPLGHGALTGKPPKGDGGECSPCAGWWSTWIVQPSGKATWEFSFSTGPYSLAAPPMDRTPWYIVP